jgi:hypothetical protein
MASLRQHAAVVRTARLRGARVVKRDLGVRIDHDTRSFLDGLRDQYHLQEAELVRVLLASAFLLGNALQDRVAAALYVNAIMQVFGEASALVASLRSELARLSTTVAEATSSIPMDNIQIERGPRDPSLVRVKPGDLLHARLRDLVEIYLAVRQDGEIPEAADLASRQLIQHLLSRSTVQASRERSPVAEVIRWAISASRADAEHVLAEYVRCRRTMWSRIEEATRAMRDGALRGLQDAFGGFGHG